MSDLIRRLNRLEKEFNQGGDQIGHCKECGKHLCWKLDPSTGQSRTPGCEICPPSKFCIDLTMEGGKDCGHDHDFVCPTCGYGPTTYVINLGGELWNEGIEDDY